MTLTADAALDAYEAARHRLPAVPPFIGTPEHVASLADIAARFDVFLLDAFGVLNVGETVIPGVPASVAALQEAGKHVLVVSNAASVRPEALLEKYNALGYHFTIEDIVTSRQTLSTHLSDTEGHLWGVVAPEAADLGDLGLARTVSLGDDPAVYDACDAVLLIGTGEWTEARQSLLEAAMRRRSRPVLVANPDIVAPREAGFSIEPGHIAHKLADIADVAPVFFGKPFANIFDLVFARLGKLDPARVLMVGDSLHTDILGARAYGIASALVPGFGFFAGGGAQEAIARSGISPDLVVRRP